MGKLIKLQDYGIYFCQFLIQFYMCYNFKKLFYFLLGHVKTNVIQLTVKLC